MRASYDEKQVSKRKIVTKKDLMREMYCCKYCDCDGYPWCVYMGGLCKHCVDLNEYHHKLPLRSRPGEYSSASRKTSKSPEITYPRLRIIKTDVDGDCLYQSISLALSGALSINQLRYLVSIHQTNSTFAAYKELSTFMPEYRQLHCIHSLRDFRLLIRKSGKDIGVKNCIWGDENALQIISTFLRLGIKIFNEKGQYIQEIIPERTSTFDNTNPSKYVLLLLNSSKPGNEHYNLMEFNHHTLLSHSEWEKMKSLISQSQLQSP